MEQSAREGGVVLGTVIVLLPTVQQRQLLAVVRLYTHTHTHKHSQLSTSDHVTASLLELQWLPVQQCIKFKLCCIMLSVFCGRCPAYLTTTVQSLKASRPHLGQRLRSTSSNDFSLPQLRTKRAFSHAGPASWNSMPKRIRDIGVFLGNCWRCIFLT